MTTAHNPSEAESSGNILHPSLDLPSHCLHCHTQQLLGESPVVEALDVMVVLSFDTATQGHRHPTKTHSQLISGMMEWKLPEGKVCAHADFSLIHAS